MYFFPLDPQNNIIIVILQVKKMRQSKVICPSHAYNWTLLTTNPLLFTPSLEAFCFSSCIWKGMTWLF